MKTLVPAVSAALSAALVWGSAAPVHAADAPSPSAAEAEAPRQAYYPNVDWIVCEINRERAARGLPGLRVSDRASEVGRSHAKDMAAMGRLTSVGSDGRDLRSRMSDAGLYSGLISESMAYGYTHDGYFADRATDPDPGNGVYKVLMNRGIVAIGIGYDRRYWDVNLLGAHRKLVTRAPAGCGVKATAARTLPAQEAPASPASWSGPVVARGSR
ncbi:CAP domain-containing protein [Streptomyces wuyuanensis]|uniref:Cysteine-rich secretory protein family protein n=1 Tax=Streptomyces wuyuanensis TaxID=1196353 RepID=A0A1H0CU64_9ACTN|nr:CAP domain-containing protein [Streptomyces wuyuanensis]SDN61450.1 Cysteine-rich secretory protein family protein [Streptomyces wuyuanensis]